MVQQLPTRLGKSPLVEAVFELRVDSNIALSQIISGILYSQLGCQSIEKTPQGDIPEVIRLNDPNLKYVALVRLLWDNYYILIGDNVLCLSTSIPYPGWKSFKERISQLLNTVAPYGFIRSTNRFSLKYIDLFPLSDFQLTDQHFAINIQIANCNLNPRATHVRTEIQEESAIHIVQLTGEATGRLPHSDEEMHGILMEIDSIQKIEDRPFVDFLESSDNYLDMLHDKNKELFFSMLSPKGLNKLEPEYD